MRTRNFFNTGRIYGLFLFAAYLFFHRFLEPKISALAAQNPSYPEVLVGLLTFCACVAIGYGVAFFVCRALGLPQKTKTIERYQRTVPIEPNAIQPLLWGKKPKMLHIILVLLAWLALSAASIAWGMGYFSAVNLDVRVFSLLGAVASFAVFAFTLPFLWRRNERILMDAAGIHGSADFLGFQPRVLPWNEFFALEVITKRSAEGALFSLRIRFLNSNGVEQMHLDFPTQKQATHFLNALNTIAGLRPSN